MKPVIHSVKHYVQTSLSTVTTGAILNTSIIESVVLTSSNLANEVKEGAIVKSVFVELWVIGSVSNQFFTITIDKVPAGATPMTSAESASLFTYQNKKNILYTTQGLASNDGIAGPIPVIRQWFKIPKGKQRFGLADKLFLNVHSRGSDDLIICGFNLYKEYD